MSREVKRTSNRWARLSIGYHRDTKIIEVGPIGEVAFIRLLALAREVIEQVDVDGAIPKLLAARELREVTDLYTELNPGKKFDDLIEMLSDVGLIHVDGNMIIVSGYGEWQTTRSEIDAAREENRLRVAAHRARKAVGKTNDSDNQGGDEDMGVYDNSVEAFADLRDSGNVKKGKTKIGKHGLDPRQVEDAERIVEHLVEKRKEVLGGNFKITTAWWGDVKKLLNGSGDAAGLTAAQVCDLIDFALTHKFWHAHCQTPAGLAKHAGKLYTSDEYISWSLKNKRPEENRPRNTLIGDQGATFRGGLAADKKVDWSKVGEEL
jgi:hypothetical protein